MKVWKLVSGVISLVLSVLVLMQSCVVGFGEALTDAESMSGTSGIVVAFLMIAGGIVSIVTRNAGRGGGVATAIIYFLAAVVGFAGAGVYTDLNIWAAWCAICVVLAVIAAIRDGRIHRD